MDGIKIIKEDGINVIKREKRKIVKHYNKQYKSKVIQAKKRVSLSI